LTEDESAAIRLYTMEWDGTDEEERASLYAHQGCQIQNLEISSLLLRNQKFIRSRVAKPPDLVRSLLVFELFPDQNSPDFRS
jgi:hypothetical protein